MKLFSYGTLLIPEITQELLGFPLIPEKSVFIRGYKMELLNGNYGYLMCKETGNSDDIVAGFIVEVPDNLFERLDRYEGNGYRRATIVCYDRKLNEINSQIYLKN